jgi:hypothetical protein
MIFHLLRLLDNTPSGLYDRKPDLLSRVARLLYVPNLTLAGVEYSEDTFTAANAAIRHATATSNWVTVAHFFLNACRCVLDGLLASAASRDGDERCQCYSILTSVGMFISTVARHASSSLCICTRDWENPVGKPV